VPADPVAQAARVAAARARPAIRRMRPGYPRRSGAGVPLSGEACLLRTCPGV
jgi:hypothetical protein